MKKIFWTTIFRLFIVLAFVWYLRRFDSGLSKDVSKFIWTQIVCDQNIDSESLLVLSVQIRDMKLQLDKMSDSWNKSDPIQNGLEIVWPKTVNLYYFNQLEDAKLPVEQQLNYSSILAVPRVISDSKNIIEDTINLLLEWNLNSAERTAGFTSEFPNQDFRLISSELKSDWTLELRFNEVMWFTSWWSARVFILKASIEKTAKQFDMVKIVKILPDTLFQP